eukprot:764343-Alexandrium_andersonii.AAC.1
MGAAAVSPAAGGSSSSPVGRAGPVLPQGEQGGHEARAEPASAGVDPPSSRSDDRGQVAEAMSDIGEPAYPEDSDEDVGEEMMYL